MSSHPLIVPPRVSVTDECVSKYNELKLGKKLRYITYKLSVDDNTKEIVVDGVCERNENSSAEEEYEAFCSLASEKKPMYAVYFFEYQVPGEDGMRFVLPLLVFESRVSQSKKHG